MKWTTRATLTVLMISFCSCENKNKEITYDSSAKEQQSTKTHESILKNSIASLGEMRDILLKVRDIDSAKTALPALTKLGFKLKMIKTDMQKLDPSAENLSASLKKKYDSAQQVTVSEIGYTMRQLKVSNPEAYSMIAKVMKTIMD